MLRNNENLSNNIINNYDSLYWGENDSFDEEVDGLVIEPWLKRILEEKSGES